MTIDEKFNLIKKEDMPKHVAIIPNGNRTWAKLHGLTAVEGHNTGVEILIKFARIIKKWGIHTSTVWGTSTENLVRREPLEIANLMRLLKYVMDIMGEEAHADGTRLVHIGNK